MKKKLNIILILLTAVVCRTYGQIPDSTLYRMNKVKKVNSWMHVIGFETTDDTCLFAVKEINKYGNPTYIKIDYSCQGWDILNEIKYTYDSNQNVIAVEAFNNGLIASKISKKLDKYGRAIEENNVFMEPYTEIKVKNRYFGDTKLADSMYTMEINNGDTLYTRTAFTYEKGKLVRSETVDITKNAPVNTLTNKYDKRDRLIKSQFIYFLGYDNDVITEFSYNEKNQIVQTKSELEEVASEFFYNSKNGLLIMTRHYNRFGTPEKDILHKYEFYE